MYRIAIVVLCIFAVSGCESETSTSESSSPAVDTTPVAASFNAEGLPTVAFKVPKMMCETSCVPTVKKILAEQPGVKDVEVILETKTATVAVDRDQFDAEAAIAALLDMQFDETAMVSAKDSAEAKKDVAEQTGQPSTEIGAAVGNEG